MEAILAFTKAYLGIQTVNNLLWGIFVLIWGLAILVWILSLLGIKQIVKKPKNIREYSKNNERVV